MRVLVLGAYGLIGGAVTALLGEHGHTVIGLGRDTARAARRLPDVQWLSIDLQTLRTAEAWRPILRDAACDAVVNCAGVLQDGSRDDVAAVQTVAMTALVAALAGAPCRYVQMSAVGAGTNAETLFMRTKGEADDALRTSSLDWVIFRPGLVLAPEAYGGTALLRALAAMPLLQPLAFPDATVRTVWIGDVAQAVLACLDGRVPMQATYDLVETEAHTLRTVVSELRRWLGIAPAPILVMPAITTRIVGRIADGLGWLGWRSPFRTTALIALQAGIDGDPRAWQAAGGATPISLAASLQRMPSTVQERWFARLFLLKPVVIVVLALFWLLSGAIALAAPDAAAATLTTRGVATGAAQALVIGGSILDLVLGLAMLHRRSMRWAALGMIGLSTCYLVAGTLLTPDLWADPLGPLVKIVPSLLLAVVALALAEDR